MHRRGSPVSANGGFASAARRNFSATTAATTIPPPAIARNGQMPSAVPTTAREADAEWTFGKKLTPSGYRGGDPYV